MKKSAKVHYASVGVRRVTAEQVDEGEVPVDSEFRCDECGIRLRFVPRRTEGTRKRVAYFGRPGSQPHEDDCGYNVDVFISRLVESTRGFSERDGKKIRLKLPDLAPLMEPVDDSRKVGMPDHVRVGTSYVRTGQAMDIVMGSAKRIVEFLRVWDFDQTMLRRFAIVHNGVALPWDEFCCGYDDLGALTQELQIPETRKVPHAVFGPMNSAREITSKKGNIYYKATRPTELTVHEGGDDKPLRVALLSSEADHLASLVTDRQFLGLGFWDTYTNNEMQSHELKLWVNYRWQLMTWNR